jgi:DNA-binding MarR family transcriptional regulator
VDEVRTGARTHPDEVLLALLRLAMGVSVEAADRIGTVSAVQLRAVTLLHQQPGANLGELARGMGVSVSVTSRLVDRLVAAGLVDKTSSATSGREISLWLSEAGEATLDRYDDLRLSRIRARLEELSAEDAAAVVSALEVLVPDRGRGPDRGSRTPRGPAPTNA